MEQNLNTERKYDKAFFQTMLKEFRWILHSCAGQKRAAWIYLFLGFLGMGLGLLGSFAFKRLVDTVTGGQAGFAATAAWMTAVFLLSLLLGAAASRLSASVDRKNALSIQKKLYQTILSADWEKISHYKSGDLVSRLHRDTQTVASVAVGFLPGLFLNLFQFGAILCVIFYYDHIMAVISLLGLPASFLASRMLLKKMRAYREQNLEIESEIMSFHTESIENLQEVKAFGFYESFFERLSSLQKRQYSLTMDYNRFSIFTSFTISLVGLAVSFAVLIWGVYRLGTGHISYGTLVLFLTLSGRLSSSFSSLMNMAPSLIGATAAAGRLIELFETKKETGSQSPLPDDFCAKGVTVSLRQVDFSYEDGGLVLENACLLARPGEAVALIGPSGGGKTTLLRLCLGLVSPDRGQVEIIGSEIRQASFETRAYFSYVPQDNTAFSGTIAENMRLSCPGASDEEIMEALRTACADQFVSQLPRGIHSQLGERGMGLSEGQLQRLSIARAVLRGAPVLLLDEATSALDPDTEAKVLENIMASGKNRTCIFTTHRSGVIAACDRVYEVKNGRVTEK